MVKQVAVSCWLYLLQIPRNIAWLHAGWVTLPTFHMKRLEVWRGPEDCWISSDLIALIGSVRDDDINGIHHVTIRNPQSDTWPLAVFTTLTSYIAKFQQILTSCTTFPVCFGCFLLGHKMIPFSGCHWNPIKNCSEAGIYKSATGVVYEGQFKTLGIAQAVDPLWSPTTRNLERRDIHISKWRFPKMGGTPPFSSSILISYSVKIIHLTGFSCFFSIIYFHINHPS